MLTPSFFMPSSIASNGILVWSAASLSADIEDVARPVLFCILSISSANPPISLTDFTAKAVIPAKAAAE